MGLEVVIHLMVNIRKETQLKVKNFFSQFTFNLLAFVKVIFNLLAFYTKTLFV